MEKKIITHIDMISRRTSLINSEMLKTETPSEQTAKHTLILKHYTIYLPLGLCSFLVNVDTLKRRVLWPVFGPGGHGHLDSP